MGEHVTYIRSLKQMWIKSCIHLAAVEATLELMYSIKVQCIEMTFNHRGRHIF